MEVNTNIISHAGTIKSINNQHLIVKIISQTACASCHAKGACSSSEQSEKEVQVIQRDNHFFVGEEVLVVATTSQGYKAIFYAYLLPLLLLIINLGILISITGNEAISALGSILFLTPYYLTLFLCRNKFLSTFNFTVQKLSNSII